MNRFLHLCSKLNEFVMIAPLFPSFIKPGTFLLTSGLYALFDRVIACVKSNNRFMISYIVAFNVIYEIILIGVHTLHFSQNNSSYIYSWNSYKHVLDMSRICHIDWFVELHLEFTHCYQILRKDATTVKIWFCDHCLRAVSPVSTCQKSHVNMIAHVLHGFAEHRIVH